MPLPPAGNVQAVEYHPKPGKVSWQLDDVSELLLEPARQHSSLRYVLYGPLQCLIFLFLRILELSRHTIGNSQKGCNCFFASAWFKILRRFLQFLYISLAVRSKTFTTFLIQTLQVRAGRSKKTGGGFPGRPKSTQCVARAACQCVCKPNLNHVQTLDSGLSMVCMVWVLQTWYKPYLNRPTPPDFMISKPSKPGFQVWMVCSHRSNHAQTLLQTMCKPLHLDF